jgi:hypothetical protein
LGIALTDGINGIGSSAGVQVTVCATPNTVLALCPERLQVMPSWHQPDADNQGVWVLALLALRDTLEQELGQGAVGRCVQVPHGFGMSKEEAEHLLQAVQLRLQEMQQELSANNSAVGVSHFGVAARQSARQQLMARTLTLLVQGLAACTWQDCMFCA